jgi:membrane-bound ClpP family serine protease
MPAGPNTAFLLLVSGLLAIECECIWPGRVFPGVAGAAAAIAGAWLLFRPPLEITGVSLLAASVVLLTAEALLGPYLLFGVIGALALIAGFSLLLPPSRAIAPAVAVPCSALLGFSTALLASLAKRARRNKWSDISGGK